MRLAVAVLLGGAIGYERELREVPAGLRTHLLVSLASATFALVSLRVASFQHYSADVAAHFDGGRIASNIVVGIGFLGGGAIMHSGLNARGLTTAASLWLTASVGLAAGGGMFLLATASTVSCLFALVGVRFLVEGPRKRVVKLGVTIEIDGEFLSRLALVEFLEPVGGRVTGVDYSRDFSTNRSRMMMQVRLPEAEREEALLTRLESIPGLRTVRVERAE